jgi:RNA polymerase sigma factor (sigma-70 family)
MSLRDETVRDELLVREIQSGRVSALDELVERWQGRLLAHARRLAENADDAWDVFQESWVAIVRGIRWLQDPASFRSWAYRIVTNKGRDWIARRNRERQRLHEPHQDATEGPAVAAAPDEADELHAALLALSIEHRMILSLRYLEQMSFDEIVMALGIPEGTVKSRLYYARCRLKAVLEQRERRVEPTEPTERT